MRLKLFAIALIASILTFGCVTTDRPGVVKESFTTVVNVELPSCARQIDDLVFMDFDSVDPFTLDHFRDVMYYMGTNGLDTLILDFMNPGGSVFHMWAIYDLLERGIENGLKLRCWNSGFVASAAVPIFLLGEYRGMAPNARFMIHPHSGVTSDYNDPSVNKMFMEWTEKYAQILAEKTNFTLDEARVMLEGNYQTDTHFFNAQESLLKGLVEEIK